MQAVSRAAHVRRLKRLDDTVLLLIALAVGLRPRTSRGTAVSTVVARLAAWPFYVHHRRLQVHCSAPVPEGRRDGDRGARRHPPHPAAACAGAGPARSSTTSIPLRTISPPRPGRVGRHAAGPCAGLGRQAWAGPCSPNLRHPERRRPSLGLPAGGLAWGCMIFPEVADFSTFGPKTDTTLCGQAAVLPSSEASNSGLRALQEGTRARLLRLAAQPPLTLQQMADRFRASRSAQEISQGSPPSSPTGLMIFAPWPPRFTHAGGWWPGARPAHLRRVAKHASRRDAETQRSRFKGCRRSAPILAGVEVDGFGSHSFRRGSALALFHSGADRVAVTEALRCSSLSPSRPYITDAARMAGPAVTTAAAAPCRPISEAADHDPRGRAGAGPPVPPAAFSDAARRGSSYGTRICTGSARPDRGSMRARWGALAARRCSRAGGAALLSAASWGRSLGGRCMAPP